MRLSPESAQLVLDLMREAAALEPDPRTSQEAASSAWTYLLGAIRHYAGASEEEVRDLMPYSMVKRARRTA